MRLLMLGASHRTAALELRERLVLEGEKLAGAVEQFRANWPGVELVILSTCNRMELYAARATHASPTPEELLAFLGGITGVEEKTLLASTIQRENAEAASHLFQVASGLDSMVLGEPQILGQVKRAYEAATEHGTAGTVMHKLFQQALAAARQTRAQTGIDAGRVSIGSVAVQFAQEIFSRFDDKTILAIGAGDMAKIALKHLAALNPAKLWIANRSPDKAQALMARLALPPAVAGVRPLQDLDSLLVEADIVLTSTSSPQPIITAQDFKAIIRRRRGRAIFMIDIALPRDIEPQVGSLSNVYLYNLDDLQKVVDKTLTARGSGAAEARELARAAAQACFGEIQHRDVGQLIRALREKLHELGRLEHERTANKLAELTPAQIREHLPEILDEHNHRLINKILHMPISQLDARDPDAPLGFYAAALRRLFDLETAVSQEPERPTVKDAEKETLATDKHG